MIDVVSDREVVRVTMNHGPVNAMDIEFCNCLSSFFVEHSGSGSVFVLTGNAKVFSAGVNLKRLVAEPPDYVDDFFPALRRLFDAAWNFPQPLIALINGAAVAGGCVLASAGDKRLLAANAAIGMPEARVGLPLPAEGVEIIRSLVPAAHLEAVLDRGESWQGEKAVNVGLASEVIASERMDERALQLASDFAAMNRDVFRIGKRQRRMLTNDHIRRHDELFSADTIRLWKDPAVREAVSIFVASRL